jgi:hypothetical protein
MTRTRSITTFLASATALVLAASAVAGCGSDASGRPPARKRQTDGRRRLASPTKISARSSSTRRAAPSTCSRRTLEREVLAPAHAPVTGLQSGQAASQRSVAERTLRWLGPPLGPTEPRR